MGTNHTSANAAAGLTVVERIDKAVHNITRRLFLNGFDVISIQASAYSGTERITVAIHAKNGKDVHRIANYFRLDTEVWERGGTFGYKAQAITGTPDVAVEVYGSQDAEVTA